MLQAKIWFCRLKIWSKIIGLFLLGVITGIAYYIAIQTFQELGTVRYAVVREADAYSSRGEARATNTDTAIGYVQEGIDSPSQFPDPCTLRDVTCDGEDIEGVIMQLFPEDPKTALAIAKAESGLRSDARNINRNGTTDTGIFQINSVHGYPEEVLLDPIENAKIARKIYKKSGFGAWSAFNNKSYLKFYEGN